MMSYELTIFTNQGEIKIDEEQFARQSKIYFSLLYQQSPFQLINYTNLIQQKTFIMLKNYLETNEIDKKHVNEKIIQLCDFEIFKELYVFLKQWEIGDALQKLIVKTIKYNVRTNVLFDLYISFIRNNINVDIFEDEIIHDNILIYLELSAQNYLSKTIDKQIRYEKVVKLITYCLTFLPKEKNIPIVKKWVCLLGKDLLIVLYNSIKAQNWAQEDSLQLFNIFSNENDFDKESNADKLPPNSDETIKGKEDKNIESSNLNIDALFNQIFIFTRQIITLINENNFLKKKFVELNINEKSTDDELFDFHVKFLLHRSKYYKQDFSQIKNTTENHGNSSIKLFFKQKKQIEYSKEMIERGIKWKIQKIMRKTILDKSYDTKNAYKICKSLYKTNSITPFSLCKVCFKLCDIERTLFEKIFKIINKNVTNIEDLFLLKIMITNKNNKKDDKVSKQYHLDDKPPIQTMLNKCDKLKTKLKAIKIPKFLKQISKEAFSICLKLSEVEIEEGISSIGSFSFGTCESLKRINIPKSINKIDDGAFYRCISLKDIEIHENIDYIGTDSFYGCKSLEKIKIPKINSIHFLNVLL